MKGVTLNAKPYCSTNLCIFPCDQDIPFDFSWNFVNDKHGTSLVYRMTNLKKSDVIQTCPHFSCVINSDLAMTDSHAATSHRTPDGRRPCLEKASVWKSLRWSVKAFFQDKDVVYFCTWSFMLHLHSHRRLWPSNDTIILTTPTVQHPISPFAYRAFIGVAGQSRFEGFRNQASPSVYPTILLWWCLRAGKLPDYYIPEWEIYDWMPSLRWLTVLIWIFRHSLR